MSRFLENALRHLVFAGGLMFLLTGQADSAFELDSIVYSRSRSTAEFEMSSGDAAGVTIKVPKDEVPKILKSMKTEGEMTVTVEPLPADPALRLIKIDAKEGGARIRYERVITPADFTVDYNLNTSSQKLQAVALAVNNSGADVNSKKLTVTYADSNGILTFPNVALVSSEFAFLNDAKELKDVKLSFNRQSYLKTGGLPTGTSKQVAYAVGVLKLLEGRSLAIPEGTLVVPDGPNRVSFTFGGKLKVNEPFDVLLEADSRLSVVSPSAQVKQAFPYIVEATSIEGGMLIGPAWQFMDRYTFTNNTNADLEVRVGLNPEEIFTVRGDGKSMTVEIRQKPVPDELMKVDLLSVDDDAKLVARIEDMKKLRIIAPKLTSAIEKVRSCYNDLHDARADQAALVKRKNDYAALLEGLRAAGAYAGQLDHIRCLVYQAEDEIAATRSKESDIKIELFRAAFLTPPESSHPPARRSVIKHSGDASVSIAGR